MIAIRKRIKRHIASRKKLDAAMHLVFNSTKSIYAAAMLSGIKHTILQRKINITNKMVAYFKEKSAYETAVHMILNETRTIINCEEYYKLDLPRLNEEIDQYKRFGTGPYEYDKPINLNTEVFTFNDEISLLLRLRWWKKKSLSSCVCQICAMEYLLRLAYQFAQENNKSYPKAWDTYKQADEEWLIDFEMAHSKELSRMFPHDGIYKECKREEESSLFNEKSVCEMPSNFNVLYPTNINSLGMFNVNVNT